MTIMMKILLCLLLYFFILFTGSSDYFKAFTINSTTIRLQWDILWLFISILKNFIINVVEILTTNMNTCCISTRPVWIPFVEELCINIIIITLKLFHKPKKIVLLLGSFKKINNMNMKTLKYLIIFWNYFAMTMNVTFQKPIFGTEVKSIMMGFN